MSISKITLRYVCVGASVDVRATPARFCVSNALWFAPTQDKRTLLALAAGNGHIDCVKFLIDANATVDSLDIV
jgi:ankyrin repeat protein